MTLYDMKPAFQEQLRPAAALLAGRGWTANQLTAVGFIASGAAGASFALGTSNHRWMLLVPVFLFARMAFNALDGIVAREHGQATACGRVVNELGDVAGDAVAYLPLGLVLPEQSFLVAIVVVLSGIIEFTALLDPRERRNEGPFGKSDRATAVGLLAIVLGAGLPAGDWTSLVLLLMAAAGLSTVRNRLRGQT